MDLLKQKSKNIINSGQTLLEILIALVIFAILLNAIFTVVSSSLSVISFNRARITARHMAQEKMEIIRNLPYNDVATIGGIPNGDSIPQIETVQRNSLNYTVKTSIIFIDDPFDGVQGGSPEDLLPTDYKRVRIEVSWGGIAASGKNPVVFVSDIAPKGVEQAEGGGTLSILVFNASGQPVPQADVSITSPEINLNLQTGANGRIILPGAPECISCYEISVSKSGYTSDRTYSNTEIANPNKPHQTILEGYLTETSFAIDLVSTITLNSLGNRNSGFTPLGNISFRLRGTNKTLGTNALGETVYLVDDIYTTNDSGSILINNFVWDTYVISVSGTTHDISGISPMLPFVINPGTTYNYSIALDAYTSNSLLLSFKDNLDNPVASVSANLSDGLTYNETIFSGETDSTDFGQAFFANLDTTTYTLTATASGFNNLTDTINISGSAQESYILIPQ